MQKFTSVFSSVSSITLGYFLIFCENLQSDEMSVSNRTKKMLEKCISEETQGMEMKPYFKYNER